MDRRRPTIVARAMNPPQEFYLCSNGTSVPWAEVPVWPAEELVAATAAGLARGGRLCAWFGVPEGAGTCF